MPEYDEAMETKLRARVERSRHRDSVHEVPSDTLTTYMLKDKNTVTTNGAENNQTRKQRIHGEEVFDEMVNVEVKGLRVSTLRQPLEIGEKSKIGWSAQSKCSEHSESARKSAEIWIQLV